MSNSPSSQTLQKPTGSPGQRTRKARRTRRNDGYSVTERKDGRWMARVLVGYKNGKAQHKCLYGKTRDEAVRQAQDFLHGVRNGAFTPVTKESTLGEWLDRWLGVYVTKATHAPKTVKSYEGHTRNHIKPSLGKLKLGKLTAQHVQTMLGEKTAAGLSASSVNGIHRVLRAALSQAEVEGLVAKNVAKNAKPPRAQSRGDVHFTRAELAKLNAAAKDHHLANLFGVASHLGLRIGEMTGLQWSDVDLNERTIAVSKQLQWENRKPTLRPLKTDASRRALPLSDAALTYFKAQNAMRLVDEWPNPMNLVFLSTTGTPLDPRGVNKHLKTLCAKAGITPKSFHKFRHTAATHMLASGEDSANVMHFLGHNQIAVTVNTYVRAVPESMRRATNKLSREITGEAA